MRQLGPETSLQNILIVVENGGKGGRIKAAALIHSQKWQRFGLWLYNQRSYGQMETPGPI